MDLLTPLARFRALVRAPLILVLLLGVIPAAPAIAGVSETPIDRGPLRVRNLSPVMQLYGMPRMLGSEIHSGTLESTLNFEIGNNFQSDRVGSTFVFFDGETYVTSYRLRNDISERWEWGAEVPWVVHAPGSLDGLVDEFHELFGLPDGDRSLAPRGRLDYLIRSDGIVYADFSDSRRELGDVRAFVGWQAMEGPAGSLALRSQVKFPTGKVKDLSGSEGLDVSVWGEYALDIGGLGRMTLGAGVSHLGEGKLIPDAQERWLYFGHLGLQIPLHPRFEFLAQLDAHSRVLDTGNPLIADGGVLGTLGGRVGFTERVWLDLAIIEDLENEAASDVVFQILLGARL